MDDPNGQILAPAPLQNPADTVACKGVEGRIVMMGIIVDVNCDTCGPPPPTSLL